jgi:hypothetical protein
VVGVDQLVENLAALLQGLDRAFLVGFDQPTEANYISG